MGVVKILPRRGNESDINTNTLSQNEIGVSKDTHHLFINFNNNITMLSDTNIGNLADRPQPKYCGRYYFAKDTYELYLDDSSRWILLWSRYKYIQTIIPADARGTDHKGDFLTRSVKRTYITFTVDDGYVQGTIRADFYIIGRYNRTVNLKLTSDYGKVGEAYNNKSESYTISNYHILQNTIQTFSLNHVITQLESGHSVGVQMNWGGYYAYPLYLKLTYKIDTWHNYQHHPEFIGPPERGKPIERGYLF